MGTARINSQKICPAIVFLGTRSCIEFVYNRRDGRGDMSKQSQFSRRDALKASLLAGATGLFGSSGISIVSADEQPVAPRRPGGVRFAHLTDMHVQPEHRAGDGWAAALRSLQ